MLFRELAIRGSGGTLLYGYQIAAALRTWMITRNPTEGPWVLTATVDRVQRPWIGSRPLYFTARRLGGGRWCWPVLELQIDNGTMRARLGLPEQ